MSPRSLALRLGDGGPELRCHGVLFDMDGVLVDSVAVIRRQLRDFAAKHGLDAERVIDASHGATSTDLIRAVSPWLDIDREARAMVHREITDVRGVKPSSGARALIGSLPAQSWALVTSADARVASARLAAAGLPRPATLVCAGDVRRGKPDPQGYLLAARRMNLDPRDCVVVEDAPAGIAAARAAGCQVIAVSGTVEPHLLNADVVVPSLATISLA